ncbi:MAG: glycoside hydrolase family 3 protein [Syntrophales bacterium]|nr:glycoside hydrolase family 3 protein [Syntrophales bacterium]
MRKTGISTKKKVKKKTDVKRGLCLFLLVFWILILSIPFMSSSASGELAEPSNKSLDTQIGQMLMVGFRGLAADNQSPIIQDIRKRNIGGVILFDYDVPSKSPIRNIKSPEQVKALTAALQKASSIPLFIAIDQEGGKVNRLKEKSGFPPSVSEQCLGSIDNSSTTERFAKITAKTLANLGINLNFAPVVDLNINSDNPVIGKLERSFSADPDIVVKHSLIVINTLHDFGVLSAIKHFPGHGSSLNDSHKGLVDVTNSWSPNELKPFEAIIKSGKCNMIMTAHIFNGKIDPEWPATLSSRTVKGILRKDLKYRGVVISDDMQMKAIRSFYGLETAIKMAISSGVDILLFANNSVFEEDIATRALAIIKKLLTRGEISPRRINESYMRIMKLKEKINYPAASHGVSK